MRNAGLQIAVGAPCLVNEFHDPNGSFHQVDIYFTPPSPAAGSTPRGATPKAWSRSAGFVTEPELRALRFKPDSLPDLAFGAGGYAAFYDPLEPIVL